MKPADGIYARKPPHGSPCNGCGVCCMVTLCPLGQHILGFELGRCPALTKRDDTTYVCGLVLDPAKYAPTRAVTKSVAALRRAALLLIGSGDGCDARLNGEPRNFPYEEAIFRKCARHTQNGSGAGMRSDEPLKQKGEQQCVST
jgi:hypothetical protein